MRAVLRWVDRGLEALAVLGVSAYAAAAMVTVADVIGRQMGMPVEGVVDIVQMCVLGGAWLVIPWAFVAGAHVGVDFVLDALPRGAAQVFRVGAALLAGILMALMLRYAWDAYGIQSMLGDRSQQLGIPIRFYWLPLLLGQAAAIVAVLSVIMKLTVPSAKGEWT